VRGELKNAFLERLGGRLTPRSGRHDAEIDRVYVSWVERAAIYVRLEVIGMLVTILEVEPAEFVRRRFRSESRKRAD
jgi:hypothetical protein